MKHEPQGLERYANTDPSTHFNTIEPAQPDWRDEYLALLMKSDNEAAHELRLRNDPKYADQVEAECQRAMAATAHLDSESDLVVTVLRAEHARIQSCGHLQIERDEMEAA